MISYGQERCGTVPYTQWMRQTGALTESDAQFEQLPSKAGSVANRRPNIDRLRSIMPDYEPISFEQGIRQILS